MPTLYEAAGGNASDLATDLDGISQWKALSGEDANVDDPPRSELLINIQKSHSEYAIIRFLYDLNYVNKPKFEFLQYVWRINFNLDIFQRRLQVSFGSQWTSFRGVDC